MLSSLARVSAVKISNTWLRLMNTWKSINVWSTLWQWSQYKIHKIFQCNEERSLNFQKGFFCTKYCRKYKRNIKCLEIFMFRVCLIPFANELPMSQGHAQWDDIWMYLYRVYTMLSSTTPNFILHERNIK